MKLYIIRHGETDWNKAGRLQGHTDIPLNENGIFLAEITAENMKDIPIDCMITSPLRRAYETGRIIMEKHKDAPIYKDERIQEIGFGEWEGENCLGESQIMPRSFSYDFLHKPLECQVPPNGESVLEVCARTQEFYEELVQNTDLEEQNILISTHGCASRCILRNLFEDKADIWRNQMPPNCAVSIVEVENGSGRLMEMDHIYYDEKYVVEHYKKRF